MANHLPTDKKANVVAMLCEGSGIERITGINRNTIMNLGVRMGDGCRQMMDEKMRNLKCQHIQLDEVVVCVAHGVSSQGLFPAATLR